MIRRHVRALRLALMITDAFSGVLLFVLVAILRFQYIDSAAEWNVSGVQPLQVAAAYGALWVASLWLLGLYRLRTRWSVRDEIQDVARATAVAAVASFSLLFLFQIQNVSRLFVLLLFLIQPILTLLSRLALRFFLRWSRSRGFNSRQMLIVGAGPEAQQFARDVERHDALGLRVIGHLRSPADRVTASDHPILGSVEQIEDILHGQVVDEVAVCLPLADWGYVEPIARICAEEGKIVRVSTAALGPILTGGRQEMLGDTPLITLVQGPDRLVSLAAKRSFDVAISLVGLVVLSPVMLAIACAIRMREGPPVLFRQQRVGLHGRVFTCIKFRTMEPDAEERFPEIAHLSEVRGAAFKLTDDPRITRTGRWLRRTSLDELPQLINVLRGEMSIVGPRPALAREVAEYTVWHRRRLVMRPGMTGLWQVEARRDNDFDHRVNLDLHYIDRWSIWLDLKIMLRTIPAMVQQQGR